MEAVCNEHPLFESVEDAVFWNDDYNTHWHEFSQEDDRKFQQLVPFRKFRLIKCLAGFYFIINWH